MPRARPAPFHARCPSDTPPTVVQVRLSYTRRGLEVATDVAVQDGPEGLEARIGEAARVPARMLVIAVMKALGGEVLNGDIPDGAADAR